MNIFNGLFSSITSKLALVAVAIAFAAGGYLGWHERVLREPGMIADQQAVDVKACSTAQAKTKGENDALIKDRDRIAADLAKSKRLWKENPCLHITRPGELPADKAKHAGVLGLSSEWGSEFAALCETYRSELLICTGQGSSRE